MNFDSNPKVFSWTLSVILSLTCHWGAEGVQHIPWTLDERWMEHGWVMECLFGKQILLGSDFLLVLIDVAGFGEDLAVASG